MRTENEIERLVLTLDDLARHVDCYDEATAKSLFWTLNALKWVLGDNDVIDIVISYGR